MLDNWLHPVHINSIQGFSQLENIQFGKQIIIHGEDGIPDLQGVKLALIGMGEPESNVVRSELYAMIHKFPSLEIADLGDVKKSEKSFVIPVINELLISGIIPIVIAHKKEYIDILYRAYMQGEKKFKMVLVDANGGKLSSKSIRENAIRDLLHDPQNKLRDFSLLGYQEHFLDPDLLQDLNYRGFESLNLGKLQEDIRLSEPLIRDADLFCINLSALRYSEAPSQSQNHPSGLYSEEACQLCRYAGISERLSCFGVFGYMAGIDPTKVTQTMVAQLIWYFIQGVFHRKDELLDPSLKQVKEYLVKIDSLNDSLCFVRSLRSDRWWLKLNAPEEKLIPCSEEDYRQASQNELSDRLCLLMSR